jgi:hypothetical protein
MTSVFSIATVLERKPPMKQLSVLQASQKDFVLARLYTVAMLHNTEENFELLIIFETLNVNHNSKVLVNRVRTNMCGPF